MDECIAKGEKLWKQDPGNLEAAFFLAGAHGFKGRLNSDRKNWRKATLDGRAALKWLEVSRGKEKFSPEFLFGDGLFNYYWQYIHENYALLRPVLAFFPKGTKKLGLEQLTTVSRTAFYTRTEAQTYLMRIYANEEATPEKAYPLALYLRGFFPDNPYFERSYARVCYSTGRVAECVASSRSILAKCQANYTGYEENTFRYASYFLGFYAQRMQAKLDSAEYYYKLSIEAADKSKQENSGYTLYALYFLGEIYTERKDYPAAKKYLYMVLDRGDKDQGAYKEAKAWIAKHPELQSKKWYQIF